MSVDVEPQPNAQKRQRHVPRQMSRPQWTVPPYVMWPGALRRLPPWATRPDFLAVLALATLLRLVLLNMTSFLADQAELLFLARSAVDHHALLVTGIRSSIGVLNLPASVYFLLPFALLGDPLVATLATALANVLAVVLLYALANRFAGRRVALIAGILYATAPTTVYFSRFVWQQNLLAPVVIAFFWTLCRGVLDARRGWLPWNVLLLILATQLHPSAAPLALLTLVGVAYTWRTLRRIDIARTAGVVVVLLLPTLLWEIASHGSDVTLAGAITQHPSVVTAEAPALLLSLLLPHIARFFGPNTPYGSFFHVIFWMLPLLAGLFVFSFAWLFVALARAIPDGWRALMRRDRSSSGETASVDASASLPDRRFLLLLALWIGVPLLTMLSHSTPLHEHYLLAVLPAPYLVLGLCLVWLTQRFERYEPRTLAATQPTATTRHANQQRTPARVARSVLTGLVLVLALGNSSAVVAELVTIRQGALDGYVGRDYSHYGLPLDIERGALHAASDAARANNARVYVATTSMYEEAFGYLAAIEPGSASVYEGGNCLLVPTATSRPAIVLVALPRTGETPAIALLKRIPGVRLLRQLPGNSGVPLWLYYVPAGAHLGNETPAPTPAAPANGIALAGYSVATNANGAPTITAHWHGAPPTRAARSSVDNAYWYGAASASDRAVMAPLSQYGITVQAQHLAGRASAALSTSGCSYLAWTPDDDLYSVTPLPSSDAQPLPGTAQAWRVSLIRRVLTVNRLHLGPLPLESGDVNLAPPTLVAQARVPLPGTTVAPLPNASGHR